MSMINKVPASAGAEWLLGAFALLRKAPLALGVLGVLWGLLSMLAVQAMAVDVTLGIVLQLGLALLGPFLFAGLLWAVREVEQDRPALPAHLFHAVRKEHAIDLLLTLLPQIVVALVMGFLLFVMIGPAELQKLAEVVARLQQVAQAGGQPDPELVRSLPVGRLFLWMLLLFAAVIAMSLFTFVAVPEILFGGRSGLQAMSNSFRACLHNAPALIVFLVLLLISLLVISIGVQLIAMVVHLAAGAAAGMFVSNVLLMGVVMPMMAGAVFHAWRQMLGGGATAAPTGEQGHFEA
ncbi:MAG: hypothetical protein EOP92_37500 [Lysobacteraceae bacterium]|nr:MAG: hypothetical protein EOP92_37500 [Xanthomonadaceae bacterium]